MPAFICSACGTQYPPSEASPGTCPVCIDERQFVPASGQSWTTLETLRNAHSNKFRRLAAGLTTIETTPAFAIGQRAILARTPAGNVLWECIALVDDARNGNDRAQRDGEPCERAAGDSADHRDRDQRNREVDVADEPRHGPAEPRVVEVVGGSGRKPPVGDGRDCTHQRAHRPDGSHSHGPTLTTISRQWTTRGVMSSSVAPVTSRRPWKRGCSNAGSASAASPATRRATGSGSSSRCHPPMSPANCTWGTRSTAPSRTR